MPQEKQKFTKEVEDLRQELENFQQEKELVRAIVGKIGGVPTFRVKLMNYIFIAMLLVPLVVSVVTLGKHSLLTIEIATVALSLKLIYMMHCQSKVNHFQLWMMSSLEWRINEIAKLQREMDKIIKEK